MNKDLTPDERKTWARSMYTYTDETIQDLALMTSVDETTLLGWIHDQAWSDTKRSRLTTKAKLLDIYYATLDNLHGTPPKELEPKHVDLAVKYTTAIKNLEIETSVSDIIEVSELFIRWLRRRDDALTRKVVVFFDAFIKERLAD